MVQHWVYSIAVEDYNFESGGAELLQCGATVTITDGGNTEATRLVADSVSFETE